MANEALLVEVCSKVQALGITLPAGQLRLDGYGDSDALSEELLALICQGRKRAGSSLLWAIEADGESLPQPGEIEIVLDYENEPRILTRITNVDVVPFCDVTSEYAAIEGEGDSSLEYWREAHWVFFSRECKRIGRKPVQRMPVVCSVFEVLHVLRQCAAA